MKSDEIILTNPIALNGTKTLAAQNKARIAAYFPESFAGKVFSIEPEQNAAKAETIAQRPDAYVFGVGKDGILAALWEFAESLKAGLFIDLRKIPVCQETIEVCECLDEDPYGIDSTGCLLIAAKAGGPLMRELKAAGIKATCIGTLTEGNDRILYNQGRIRYLDRPPKQMAAELQPSDL